MSNLRFRFFWQLLIAFVLVIIFAGGGIFLAGHAALNELGNFFDNEAPVITRLLTDRLTCYYEQHGSWEGVDTLLAGYASEIDKDPWEEGWQFVLATAEGAIVADATGERPGQVLTQPELARAIPIVVDNRQAGLLLLSPSDRFEDEPPAIVRGFLLAGLVIGGASLVVSLIFSRGMSQPLVDLIAATARVATGDLDVRIPVRHRGEVRELAIAFNAMTEDLARTDELRRNLTADVAHELRTPLSIIRGKLEGVLDGVYPPTPKHLKPIMEKIELLTRLVEDLHLLSLAEAGQLPLEKRATDVGALLHDTQVNFSPLAADLDVTLTLDIPPDLPQVSADRRRIAQVLGNLLTNALRHTPKGGQVTLAAAVGKRGLNVTVTDTGAGIPPEDLPYIFERFWRGEKSRSRTGGGAGLGLAITKHLIQAHGGEIRVESPSTGHKTGGIEEGTTFYFTLPLSPPDLS